MLQSDQNWTLFGYDLRRVFYTVRAGWRDFLWGTDSPVLRAVDEPVQVHFEAGESEIYRAGRPAAPGDLQERGFAEAVCLPEALVLARSVSVPAAAEQDLDAVVALEVGANSPFPADDTCHGWRIISRDEKQLRVVVVISSLGAILEYLGRSFDCHDRHRYEIWAAAHGAMVEITGFGERARHERNRHQLRRLGIIAACNLLFVVLIFASAAGMKRLQLQQVRQMYQETSNRAAAAVALREELSENKRLLDQVRGIMDEAVDPYLELTRLTALLDDTTWLQRLDIDGPEVRISGKSADAAGVMQTLTDEPAYKGVNAPVPIRRVRVDEERFVLEMELRKGDEA